MYIYCYSFWQWFPMVSCHCWFAKEQWQCQESSPWPQLSKFTLKQLTQQERREGSVYHRGSFALCGSHGVAPCRCKSVLNWLSAIEWGLSWISVQRRCAETAVTLIEGAWWWEKVLACVCHPGKEERMIAGSWRTLFFKPTAIFRISVFAVKLRAAVF